ncbi:MAG: hypothetical protein K2P81_05820 [Bacteriovoracaceae bacterium]|nr:hypothetical protein [Bacteriovoracaceae bacterium]
MRIIKEKTWNSSFFQQWVDLSHELYKNNKFTLKESLEDFSSLLEDKSSFPNEEWIAISLEKKENIAARALVTVSKLNPEIAKVGFIECIEDPMAFKMLWAEVEMAAKELGARKIKGPVNFHFFVSYRWKLWGDSKPFYGEPQQKPYYIEFFKLVGMKQLKTWDTFRIRFFRSKRQYGEIRESKKPQHRLHIRGVDMNNFEKEMEIIHGLFHDTFKEMPEFEPVSVETFKKIYAGFRYIISPLFAFILEFEGKPVAFCVNFMDPQHVLLQSQKLKKILPEILVKLWTLIQIKLNFRRLLIMYVGRLPAPNGDEFKGIQSLVAKKMTIPVAISLPQLWICYTAEDSPALKSYKEDQKEIKAKYALFIKDLE